MTDRAVMADRVNITEHVRQQVLDYLLGTLDDSELEEVKARLDSDPLYREALDWARGDMVRLESARRQAPPPPRLAERTCDFLFDPARRLRASRPRPMTSVAAAPHSRNHLSWADVGVAAVIFLISGLLVLPAVCGSRFQARLAACQDNLRQVGHALTEYSHRNHDLFPVVPAEGNLAVAGVYAPILAQDGYLLEPGRVLCPDSAQAEQRDFCLPSIEKLRNAAGGELAEMQKKMGGSYGYCLGHFDHGAYRPTRNLSRDYFAIMADAPSPERPGHQSPNHGGVGQNVLFEDSHVEFCSTSRPDKGNDDIYTNDNNEVAPGLHRDDAVIASSGTAPIIYVSLP